MTTPEWMPARDVAFAIGTAVTRNWGLVLLRGLLAVAFGVMCFAWPGATLMALVIMFAVFTIIDGIAAVIAGASSRWWGMVVIGVLGVAAGILAAAWPGMTAVVLLWVIAVWAILRGVLEIVAAIALRKEIDNEWLMILAGLASIALGVVLIARPALGALSVIWLIGGFALALGLLLIVVAFRMRGAHKRLVGSASTA